MKKKQGTQNVGSQSQRFEEARRILEAKGFYDYAFVIADGTGYARVHTVGQGKKFLDGAAFAAQTDKTNALLDVSGGEQPTTSDDEIDDVPDRASRSGNGRRAGRTTQHRGRAMLPEIETPINLPTISKPVPIPEAPNNSLTLSRPAQPSQSKSPMLSIRLDNEVAIVEFLASRLKAMQQVVDKKIAKAWIKGICPKKQARFPYSNKTKACRRLPAWWPSTDDCPFVEPDHIKRDPRVTLLIHLLRLRPSPQQLNTWNEDNTDYNETHVRQGWTAFLEEIAGPETIDECPKVSVEKAERRRKYLSQIYELAGMEEEYKRDDRDGSDRFYYQPDEEDNKRPALASAPTPVAKRPREQSVGTSSAQASRSSSILDRRPKAKRSRKDSMSVSDEPNVTQNSEQKQKRRCASTEEHTMQSLVPTVNNTESPGMNSVAPALQPRQNSWPEAQMEAIPTKTERRARPRRRPVEHISTARTHDRNQWHGSPLAPPTYLSGGATQPYCSPMQFPGRQDFGLPPYSMDRDMMQQASQSSFQSITPEAHFPASNPAVPELMGIPHYSSPEHHYAMTTLPPNCFMPAVMDHRMMDLQLPLRPHEWPMMHEQNLAGGHMLLDYHSPQFDNHAQPWNTIV